MNRTARRTIQGLMTVLMISAVAAVAQDYAIDWHTIDGGGEMSSAGGSFELAGTIGQADASSFAMPMTGGGFELVGGFWPVAGSVGPSIPGDCDGDDDVDIDDFTLFAGCLTDPGGGPVGPDCGCADFDGDEDVDFSDFAAFQVDFTG